MILPTTLQEKINSLYSKINKKTLVESRQALTNSYKTKSGDSNSLIKSNTDSIVYAISRMPATYCVIYNLVKTMIEQGFIQDVKSVFDVGSGTGAGYFALSEFFLVENINLFERDKNMISVFNELTDNEKQPNNIDINCFKPDSKADLVVSSYVLSEMTENDRVSAFKKLCEMSSKYVLVIDTGTPRTYENYLKLKNLSKEIGFKVVAPCLSEKCGLKNDYCQFYTRVERSSIMKMSKQATLSYEDEKYFYLLLEKVDLKQENNLKDLNVDNIVLNQEKTGFRRVIRRPILKPNIVDLVLCSNDGVLKISITKKDKELYKKARKIKINEILQVEK